MQNSVKSKLTYLLALMLSASTSATSPVLTFLILSLIMEDLPHPAPPNNITGLPTSDSWDSK